MDRLHTISRSLAQRLGLAASLLARSSFPAQRIIRAFAMARAVTSTRAVPFHPSSLIEEAAFSHLLAAGIIRQPSPGRYYLDTRALRNASWVTLF
jgi:hypothetical protein